MHARDLLDLAAILSAHAPQLVEHPEPLSEEGLAQYWSASKCRLDRWLRSVKQFQQREQSQRQQAAQQWHGFRGVLEEILTGEVLTRVWGVIAVGHDRRQAGNRAEPIVRSGYLGHLEARWRVLSLLNSAGTINSAEAVRLDRLRSRVERWTDLLLGYVSGACNPAAFAVDPARVKDFAGDLNPGRTLRGGGRTWSLVQAALRGAFRRGLSDASPNADLNAGIAEGILGCFPPELFDGTGMPSSLWTLRLYQTTNEVQGMIDQLQAFDLRRARR